MIKYLSAILNHLLHNRYVNWFRAVANNWRECALGAWHLVLFFFFKPPEKSVLILEPHRYHGEILPGFAKYFHDLDYNITVCCRYHVYTDDPFCRCQFTVRRFCMTLFGMRKILRSRLMSNYDFVLITSHYVSLDEWRYYGSYLKLLGGLPKSRHDLFVIEHYDNDYDSETLALQCRFFALTARNLPDGNSMPMLNPHYFGKFTLHTLSSQKRIFITVGRVINRQNRNFIELWDALYKLAEYKNFEVWVIGNVKDTALAEKLPAQVRLLGRLTFAQMYDAMDKADFFLPLLDPHNPLHQRYLTGCTSGSKQLVLGFNIIPVMHSKFAKCYDFTDDNAILHEDQKLFEAMHRALQMTPDEYHMKQTSLAQLREQVYNVSLANLQKAIESCK
jgi:hypothetical protein